MDSTQPDDGNNPDVKTILILAANPESTSRIQLDTEVREIDEGLRRGNKREQFKLEQKWSEDRHVCDHIAKKSSL